MNVTAAFRLAEGVALRRERFGGLIYRYDNRRLYFIHSPETVEFLIGLDGRRSLRDSLEEFVAQRPTGATSSEILLQAVDQLASMGIVRAA